MVIKANLPSLGGTGLSDVPLVLVLEASSLTANFRKNEKRCARLISSRVISFLLVLLVLPPGKA